MPIQRTMERRREKQPAPREGTGFESCLSRTSDHRSGGAIRASGLAVKVSTWPVRYDPFSRAARHCAWVVLRHPKSLMRENPLGVGKSPARVLAYRGPVSVPGAALTSSDGSGPMTDSHAHQRGSSAILRTWADPDVALRCWIRMARLRRPTHLTPRRDVGKAVTLTRIRARVNMASVGRRRFPHGRRGPPSVELLGIGRSGQAAPRY